MSYFITNFILSIDLPDGTLGISVRDSFDALAYAILAKFMFTKAARAGELEEDPLAHPIIQYILETGMSLDKRHITYCLSSYILMLNSF